MRFKSDRQRKAVMSQYSNGTQKPVAKQPQTNNQKIVYSKGQSERIARINKNAQQSNETSVRELQLYAENNSQLYRSTEVPIQQNLSKKWKKGTYDVQGGRLAWYNWSTQAEKGYTKEFGQSGMTVADRSKLAIIKEKEWREEMEAGNFNES